MRTASAITSFVDAHCNSVWAIILVVVLLPFAVVAIVVESHANALQLAVESLVSAIPIN